MLDAELKSQLKGYLERVTRPIEIEASVDDGEKSQEITLGGFGVQGSGSVLGASTVPGSRPSVPGSRFKSRVMSAGA